MSQKYSLDIKPNSDSGIGCGFYIRDEHGLIRLYSGNWDKTEYASLKKFGEQVVAAMNCESELTAERERSKKLRAALNDLLEQIDCLGGIEYTKDLEPYKAEAVWDDVLSRAQDVAKGDDHG